MRYVSGFLARLNLIAANVVDRYSIIFDDKTTIVTIDINIVVFTNERVD